ncbi:CYP86A1 [Symbiodinium pilosum]|uniref:CYP86A1 protein n=1 Tax=Symbiodinium pilosum TaxID=2952 RepID=A0A812U9D3_SYMPI|nr:CYP86A1 [Symbiodinium pilosum]
MQVVVGGAAAFLSVVALKQYLSRHQPKGCVVIREPGLLGCLPKIWQNFAKNTTHSNLVAYHEADGDTIYLHLGILQYFMPPLVITRDPRNVEHMLKTNFENYPKGGTMRNSMHELLGDGIFNADGDLWFKQRKTASQMFTANRFKNHIWRVVHKNCQKVLDFLSTNQEPVVDIFNLLNRFTLDSIGEIGFGTSIGSLENPVSPFLRSFDEAQRIVFRRFVLPGWRLFQLLGLGSESRSRYHMRSLRKYSSNIVEELSQTLHTEAGDSFVGLFMKGEPNSPKEFLTDLVLNFLIAGRDTTAQGMSWCLYLVMQHPEVEQKILDEVEAVCKGEALTYEKLKDLKYLEAVLRESLRLYPSVPLDSKTALQADRLPDGTFVPRGTLLLYNSYGMGRSKTIWGPDASDFRPERWLSDELKTPYENPVFHAGPRECLGKRLALVEMKTVMASLLKHVRLSLAVPPEQVLPDSAATLGMSSGLKCHVELRNP